MGPIKQVKEVGMGPVKEVKEVGMGPSKEVKEVDMGPIKQVKEVGMDPIKEVDIREGGRRQGTVVSLTMWSEAARLVHPNLKRSTDHGNILPRKAVSLQDMHYHYIYSK